MGRWRRGLVGLALAAGMAAAWMRRKPHEARVAPAVKRRGPPAGAQARSRQAAGESALSASLWRAGALAACSVAVRWAPSPVSAQFSAVICMDGPMTIKRAHYRPLERGAERAQARTVVKIKPGGAPVVRLVSAASFKPKRAMFGATELRAAA